MFAIKINQLAYTNVLGSYSTQCMDKIGFVCLIAASRLTGRRSLSTPLTFADTVLTPSKLMTGSTLESINVNRNIDRTVPSHISLSRCLPRCCYCSVRPLCGVFRFTPQKLSLALLRRGLHYNYTDISLFFIWLLHFFLLIAIKNF
jgi:hypothetical protein